MVYILLIICRFKNVIIMAFVKKPRVNFDDSLIRHKNRGGYSYNFQLFWWKRAMIWICSNSTTSNLIQVQKQGMKTMKMIRIFSIIENSETHTWFGFCCALMRRRQASEYKTEIFPDTMDTNWNACNKFLVNEQLEQHGNWSLEFLWHKI